MERSPGSATAHGPIADEHGRWWLLRGIAVPKTRPMGVFSEVQRHGLNEKEASDLAVSLAAGMLGTTIGLEGTRTRPGREGAGLSVLRPVHPNLNITQTAKGHKDLWTTTVAIAMFLFDENSGSSH